MSYDFVVNKDSPHLGGNIYQGDPWTFAPRVWRYMLDRFAISSVLDVGSGRGHAANWFYGNDCRVIAMDAEIENVNSAYYPTILHDITRGPLICPVDLVHCQEVVEHIEEEHLDKLMSTLCNGNVIIMSHATPGQDGHHHVNCQPTEYWVDAMKAKRFALLDDDTVRIRKYAEGEGAHHLARSGLVFGRCKA